VAQIVVVVITNIAVEVGITVMVILGIGGGLRNKIVVIEPYVVDVGI